jgi:hypothetical protein
MLLGLDFPARDTGDQGVIRIEICASKDVPE